ncbi:Tripartite Motif-Containing Protein 54 [Manis pentadactyla]|nr:Tripartite Motif-Containing Protein 54 [Manis pentadactyla]
MQDPRKGRGDQNLNGGGAGWERGKKGGNGARVRGAIRKWGDLLDGGLVLIKAAPTDDKSRRSQAAPGSL